MSTEQTSQFAKPRIDARALLGLYDPADTTDWAPIRAAQLHAGSQLAFFQLTANLVGAALVTLIFERAAPLWAMACWGAVVAAVAVAVTFRRLAARHRSPSSATLADVRDTVLEGVGVAFGPRDGATAEMLIRSADLALYRSKDQSGGTYHCYEPQLHVAAEERRILEQALRKALTNNELDVHYQPVVDAGTGSLKGFEALVRWTHPELGPISPAKFIPLAEDARLIAPIGEWVLRSACAEAATWPGETRIAVNVSPEQLHNPGFVAIVASALANSGLPASRLELEVTESVFMRDDTGAVKVLERILALGVRLSLDDFGTGYSSLGYLSRTKFSTIKIDRSFVIGASKKVPEAIAIIRAVVALAQSLGMATTAEGVETEDEHRMVQELGCTKVQGYYFGRPLPVSEARSLARRDWSERVAA